MTKLVLLSSIQIPPSRQRAEFDEVKLGELRDSIQNIGLLHPLVTRSDASGTWLVAGERRLRAIGDSYELGFLFKFEGQVVPLNFVPVADVGELSPLERMEAEFEENARRADLTWAESAKATTSLLQLRAAQAEAAGAPAPSIADISREVRGSAAGAYHEKTRKEVLISKHLDNPEVSSAKNLDDAFKIIKKQEVATRNLAMAAAVGPEMLAGQHTLLNVDCIAWMAAAAPAQFDVILTDPPYGMGADTFGDSGQAGSLGSHFYDDSLEHWFELMGEFTLHSFRLTKPDAHAYVFCDLDNFHNLRNLMERAGWRCFRTPLIWHKPGNFRAPWPTQGPQRKYETCLYAVKGTKPSTKLAPDVITCNTEENLGHPAQKPVDLYKELLSRSAQPGDSVFDPFGGTGPLIEAAQALHCTSTVLELDPGAYGIAASRLSLIQSAAQQGLL